MEKHRVLIVDENYVFEKELKKHSPNIYDFIHYEDWESAISELQENPEKYDAIIIDAIVKLDEDEKSGDMGNLHSVISEFKALRYSVSRISIPYIITAANHKKILKIFKNEPIIDKNDINNLFVELKNYISSKDENRIKKNYSEAFEVFGTGYLNFDAEKNLTEVLMNFENNTWSANSFNPLRKIIEVVYKSIHEYDDKLLPYSCTGYENGRVNFKYCELRLTGRPNTKLGLKEIEPVFPKHIGWLIGPITQVCHIASHVDNERHLKKYSLGTILFGVIDLLIWYKAFVDKNYKTIIE